MNNPKITVLMPVFNGAKYLRAAIDSILTQTFTDFEFLIINDGSTDDSVSIIKSYKDQRIRLVHNEKNIGLAESCNRGIDLAKGKYIARMDSDDISLPDRFKRQVNFMDANLGIGVSGTWAKIIGENQGYILKKPCDHDEALATLLFNTCFVHPSVIMRRDIIIKSDTRYKKEFDPGDDYVFWAEISRFTRFANLPEKLLLYRMHATNISKIRSNDQKNGAQAARKNLLKAIGLDPTDKELILHGSTRLPEKILVSDYVLWLDNWFSIIEEANNKVNLFSNISLHKIILNRLKTICRVNANNGLKFWRSIKKSDYFSKLKISAKTEIFLRCLIRK